MILCSDSGMGSPFRLVPFKLLDAFAEIVHFGRDRSKSFRERIVDLLGIGNHDALAFAEDDVTGHADNGGVVGNIAQHHRTGADTAVLSDRDVAENFRSAADDDAVFDRGMTLAMLFSRASESHALIESHVIANDR